MDCGNLLEPPRRGGSNEYPQSMFWAEILKLSEFFLFENFQFLEVKFSIYLNRPVFVLSEQCRPRSDAAASDLDLHCLFRPACRNT